MKTFKLIAAGIIISGLISCQKDFRDTGLTPNYDDAGQTSELNVPGSFKWNTSEDISIHINPEQKGMLLVIDDKGTVYNKAYLKAGQDYTTSVAVPTYAGKLFLYYRGAQEEVSLHSALHSSSLK